MKSSVLFFLMVLVSTFINAQTPAEIKQRFLDQASGNWYEPRSANWEYGFFDEFVVFGKEFWEYDVIGQHDQDFLLVLKKDQEILELRVARADTALFVQEGSDEARFYLRVNRVLPSSASADTSSFFDSRFHQADTAEIVGYLRGNTARDPFKIQAVNWLTGASEDYFGDVDDQGRFSVKVPLLNTTQVYMDWGRSFLVNVLHPGEQVFLFYDLDTREIVYSGPHARVQNEIARYNFSHAFVDHLNPEKTKQRISKFNFEQTLTPAQFLDFKKQELDSLKQVDELFFANSMGLSSRARYYIENSTTLEIASEIADRTYDMEGSPPPEYIQFLRDNAIDRQISPKSLIRANLLVTKAYIGLNSPDMDFVTDEQTFAALIDREKISVDEAVSSFVKLFSQVLARAGNHVIPKMSSQDSIALHQMLEQDPSIPERYVALSQEYRPLLNIYRSISLHVDKPSAVYQKHLDANWAEIFRTQAIAGLLSRGEYFPSDVLKEIIEPIVNPFFREQIVQWNSRLEQIGTSTLQYAESLKNTSHLREVKDVDELIDSILSPHKGKVVYIDFWGTWCGPCIEEMAYVPAVKEALKDKEVVFVFFANRTPENSWRTFIRDKNLEGPQTVHYNLPHEQQSMLERRLGVNSFPTYLLVNKQGEFVDMRAPRPSQKGYLLQAIGKLLDE